ncbi:ParA family protein [Ideonella livida]|uniref:ParA family protein n=1 Tax=Ideonella livida TaxID=2707176 RepID=A0A7C9TMR3_9BURK|nr:ParA family protein [Ideonella livida]NDY93424.1 ParA family protein [Ideonella livida]
MFTIAIVNRKGGCGKSTLATHLAAHFARQGAAVMLGDVDRQQSSRQWLRLRAQHPPRKVPPIASWVADPQHVLRPPPDASHVVLDTPGGLRGLELARVALAADVVLLPLSASLFDRDATLQCLAELRGLPRVAQGRCRLGAVGLRLHPQTAEAETLQAFADQAGLPLLGQLREHPAYQRCLERGLTLFDMSASPVRLTDLPQWAPVTAQLEVWRQACEAERRAERPLRALPARAPRPGSEGPASRLDPLESPPPPLGNVPALQRVLGILPELLSLRFSSRRGR